MTPATAAGGHIEAASEARWRKFLFAVALIAAAMLAVSPAVAAGPEGQVWGAVVVGRDGGAAGSPDELARYLAPLKRVFGYKSYEVLGSSLQPVREQEPGWLIPSREFYLKVMPRKSLGGDSSLFYLELYQGQKMVVQVEAAVQRGSPLLIRGPEWGKGQLIVILDLR